MAGGGANIVASHRRKNLAGPSGWVRLRFFRTCLPRQCPLNATLHQCLLHRKDLSQMPGFLQSRSSRRLVDCESFCFVCRGGNLADRAVVPALGSMVRVAIATARLESAY